MKKQKNITVTGQVVTREILPIEDPRILRISVNFYICPEITHDMPEYEIQKRLHSENTRRYICRIKGMNLDKVERTVSESVLILLSQDRKKTARELGINERTLHKRFEEYLYVDNAAKRKKRESGIKAG